MLGLVLKFSIKSSINHYSKAIDLVLEAKGILSIRSKPTGAVSFITAKSDLPQIWEHEIIGILFNTKSAPSLHTFEVVSHLESLEELMLANAAPVDHPSFNLKGLRTLKVLSLKGQWIDRELGQIAFLPNLHSLVLDSPTTESRYFETLPNLRALNSLQLVRVKLERDAIHCLSRSSILSRLELVRCSGMETCEFSQLNSCRSLSFLSVLDCDGGGNTWGEVCKLSKITEIVSDSFNPKFDEVEKQYRSLSSLRSLFLVRISFLDDSAIEMLGSLPNLSHLRIHNSRMSEGALEGLAKLNSKGVRVELQYNQVEKVDR
jgi:hypothetical protein